MFFSKCIKAYYHTAQIQCVKGFAYNDLQTMVIHISPRNLTFDKKELDAHAKCIRKMIVTEVTLIVVARYVQVF